MIAKGLFSNVSTQTPTISIECMRKGASLKIPVLTNWDRR